MLIKHTSSSKATPPCAKAELGAVLNIRAIARLAATLRTKTVGKAINRFKNFSLFSSAPTDASS